MGTSSLAWLHVQEALSETTRTCVNDRAGLGRSEPGPSPRDGRSIATELHAALAATEHAPYVLVGHSFGGWIVRIYRELYPADVAAVALLESAHEAQWARLPAVIRRLLDASLPGIQARADSARAGTLDESGVTRDRFFSQREDLWRAYRRQAVDPDHHQAHADELRAIDSTAEQVATTGPLGDVPLAVLSSAREFDPYRGSPIPVEEANRVWLELQGELAKLSTNVVHIVSMTGPHTIQYEEPHVVVGLLRELIDRARASSRTP
jgi:pimeloyl-ACP methyl ester carboxylesterase